jgi:hypothetical protein
MESPLHMAYGELSPRIAARPGQPRLKFEGVEFEVAQEMVGNLLPALRRRVLDARIARLEAAAKS